LCLCFPDPFKAFFVRLAKIKLAGFKTFVDPTTVVLPGNLVGIVGPNGCGKSNIIDAVRWVLGESRASALRGESMHDVIFNGSNTRKPVARASVEMVFDNTEGRIKGLWGSYGEISVKRVLERSGDSSYLINQKAVRRKDVIDLFLGTGLGPRAYAIIEQGMIGRIIEARPQDMRAFLEEAAGITKYRERRRETLLRLSDARENLVRLEDICTELGERVRQLEAQAEQARRHQSLVMEHDQQQQLLWLLKQEEAKVAEAQSREAMEKALAGIQADEALLDGLGDELRHAQEAETQGALALEAAQADFYAALAQQERLEQRLAHHTQLREQSQKRLHAVKEEQAQWIERREHLKKQQAHWKEKAEQAAHVLETTQGLCEALEETLRTVHHERDEARRHLADQEKDRQTSLQQQRLEEQQAQSAKEALERLSRRHEARCAEWTDCKNEGPDPAQQGILQTQKAALHARKTALDDGFETVAAQRVELQTALQDAQAHFQTIRDECARLEARYSALAALQARFVTRKPGEETAFAFLEEALPRLGAGLRVRKGWEPAFEAVLRERLAAQGLTELDALKAALPDCAGHTLALLLMNVAPHPLMDAPPIAQPSAESWAAHGPHEPLLGLLDAVENPAFLPLLSRWLEGVYAVSDLGSWLSIHAKLPQGVWLVSPSGQMLAAHVFIQVAPDAQSHGVLARQNELSELEAGLETAKVQALSAAHRLEKARHEANEAQAQETRMTQERQAMAQALHENDLALMQWEQAQAHVHARLSHLARDQAEIEKEMEREEARFMRAEALAEQHAEALEAIQDRLDHARHVLEGHEARARDLERQMAHASQMQQEARFAEREAQSGLEESLRQEGWASDAQERLLAEENACLAVLADDQATDDSGQLQAVRTKSEETRSHLEAAKQAQEAHRERLRHVGQVIQTIQTRLGTGRETLAKIQLEQQAAFLTRSQFEARLKEVNADEAALYPRLATAPKEAVLSREIGRLAREITALGAVNLGALADLEAALNRKAHLDGHVTDLLGAIATLEGVIARMDRETRDLLESTYNTVNGHFARLFPRLFGGGQARLILTGDDILDAGIQILAQPPGKKNSSIHLLSGGEKALTAIALVFSFFELNPAPFCMLDEVDAPLDDANTERYCSLVRHMSAQTQFLFISHSKITMEMARQLIGVTMQEQGVSRVVDVDIDEALRLTDTGVT
jgi:chromosome segregation protein